MFNVMVSAGFSAVYCSSGPKGMIEPVFTYTGMRSYGASTVIFCLPAYHLPEYRSYQPAPVGKYSERLVALYSYTGFTSNEGPNRYWSSMFNTAVSFAKSMANPRMIV